MKRGGPFTQTVGLVLAFGLFAAVPAVGGAQEEPTPVATAPAAPATSDGDAVASTDPPVAGAGPTAEPGTDGAVVPTAPTDPVADPAVETPIPSEPAPTEVPGQGAAGGVPASDTVTISAAPEPPIDEAVVEAAPEQPTDTGVGSADKPKPLPRGVINPTNIISVPVPASVSGGISTTDPPSLLTPAPVAGVPANLGSVVSNGEGQESPKVRALPSTGVGNTPVHPPAVLVHLMLLSGSVVCLLSGNHRRNCLE